MFCMWGPLLPPYKKPKSMGNTHIEYIVILCDFFLIGEKVEAEKKKKMASKHARVAGSGSTGNRAAPVIADRSWLTERPVASSSARAERDELARALGRATNKWEESKRKERARSRLRTASASRAEMNFVMHEVNSMDCVVKFAIGMQNDKFDLRFAPSWTPMQPAQFYVTLRPGASTKLQGWARALNAWNTTEDGGSFAYPHEAMLAFLKEAERSYINPFDLREEDDSTHTPGGDGHGGSSKAHAMTVSARLPDLQSMCARTLLISSASVGHLWTQTRPTQVLPKSASS